MPLKMVLNVAIMQNPAALQAEAHATRRSRDPKASAALGIQAFHDQPMGNEMELGPKKMQGLSVA